MTKDEKTSEFENHVLEIARIAKKAGERLDLKADAQQACFATIMIAAGNQGVFFRVANPELPKNGHTADAKAAERADAQIRDVPRHPTSEQAEEGAKKGFREGVKNACRLLNQEGFTPVLSNQSKDGQPSTLDLYIKKETQLNKPFAEFDSEDMEALIKNLSLKLEEIKGKKKEQETGAGF